MRKFQLLLLLAMTLTMPILHAQDIVLEGQDKRATLVELYSSEGCSSCPPAEQWVTRLKDNPGLWKQIIPVVFHVDYWDRLGWPDRFARKAYTQRQYDEQARAGSSSVYTPEFVVAAREWHGWFDGDALPLVHPENAGPLRVVVKRGSWAVTASHQLIPSTVPPRLTLIVAWLGMGINSDVQSGENGGKQLRHDFVVLDFQSKTASFTVADGISAELPGPNLSSKTDRPAALAAWLSLDDGTILQATGGWLK